MTIRQKQQQGVGLLEVLLALAIGAVIIIATLRQYNAVNKNKDFSVTKNSVAELQYLLKNYYFQNCAKYSPNSNNNYTGPAVGLYPVTFGDKPSDMLQIPKTQYTFIQNPLGDPKTHKGFKLYIQVKQQGTGRPPVHGLPSQGGYTPQVNQLVVEASFPSTTDSSKDNNQPQFTSDQLKAYATYFGATSYTAESKKGSNSIIEWVSYPGQSVTGTGGTLTQGQLGNLSTGSRSTGLWPSQAGLHQFVKTVNTGQITAQGDCQ